MKVRFSILKIIEKWKKMKKSKNLMIQDFGCGFAVINGKKPARDVFNDTKTRKKKTSVSW